MIIKRLDTAGSEVGETLININKKTIIEINKKIDNLNKMKEIFVEFKNIAKNELELIKNKGIKNIDLTHLQKAIESAEKNFNTTAKSLYLEFQSNQEKTIDATKKMMQLTEGQKIMLEKAYNAAKKEIPQAKVAVTEAFKKFDNASKRLINKASLMPESVKLLNKAQQLLSVIKNKLPK